MHAIRVFALLLSLAVISAVAQSPADKPYLLVLNKQGASLTVIEADTMKVRGNVPVGDSPHEVVVSEDGKTAYVANYGARQPGSSLSIIDIASMKETRRVDLRPLYRPHGVQVIGGKLYFSAESNRAIARYDPKTNKVDWIMGTGYNGSHMVVGSQDQKRFYTANIGSNNVTMFELQNVPPAGSRVFHIPVGKQPEAIDLSPDGKEVWVGLNAQEEGGAIDIVDTTQKKVVKKVIVGSRAYRVRFAPDGARVYSTLPFTKELVVTDAKTREEIKRMKFDSIPLGITFSKDSKIAFITTVQQDSVIKVDLTSFKVLGSAATGKAPDGVAVSGM